MAAFDYRMALARGLVPPIKEAQQSILKSAGGDNVFKSEAWWNEQYDKVIDKGISTPRKEYLMESYGGMFSGVTTSWMPVKTAGSGMVPRKTMPNARYEKGAPITRLNPNVMEQKDLTQAQLDSIVADQKDQIARTKREASKDTGKTKRKGRAVGGLLSKAKPVEVKGLATAMPDLGVMSLYGSDSTLGAK